MYSLGSLSVGGVGKTLNDGDNATAVKLMREHDEAISRKYQRFFRNEPKELDNIVLVGKFLQAMV